MSTAKKKKRRKKRKLAAAVVTILFIVILGALAVFRINQNKNSTAAEQQTETAAEPEPAEESAQPENTETPVPEEDTVTADETVLPAAEASPEPEPEPVTEDYTGKIRITEVMTKNRSTQLPDLSEYYDWVELKNVSDSVISTEGWSMEQSSASFELPAIDLEPGETVLYPVSSGKYLTDEDTLTLKDGSGNTVDGITIPDMEKNQVYRLTAEGEYEVSYYPTPGFENTKDGYCEYQSTLVSGTGLQISEVVVYNKSGYNKTFGGSDWIELYNASSEAIDLSEYSVSDSNDPETAFTLPDYRLQPGAYYVFLCSEKENFTYNNYLVAPISLSAENETLFLFRSGALTDAMTLNDIPLGASYGRMKDSEGFWYFSTVTPGKANSGGYRCISDEPAVSVPGGQYSSAVTVELSGSGTIYYTLDSSAPTTSSRLYTDPIEITRSTVVRAVCVEEGQMPSRSITVNYVMDYEHTIPVLCVNTDNTAMFSTLWNYGDKYTQIPGNISYYDGEDSFSINCSVSLTGGTSLTDCCKKNIIFRFKAAYGPTELDYDLFDGGADVFYSLTARSGQDYYNTVISNELCQTLCEEFTDSVLTQRGKWIALYINGRYYGIYALKENDDIMLYANKYGVDPDSVTQEKATVQEESPLHDGIGYIFTHDMSVAENYDYVCDRIDIDSLIDWTILEGWCANPDLTNGNLKYACSSEDDGKLRLVYYDLDAALARWGYCFGNLFNPTSGQESQIYNMLIRLIKNPTFKDKLLTRLAEALSGTLSDEHVVEVLDAMTEEIDAEMRIDGSVLYGWGGNTYDSWTSKVAELRTQMSTYHTFVIQKVTEVLHLSQADVDHYFGELLD